MKSNIGNAINAESIVDAAGWACTKILKRIFVRSQSRISYQQLEQGNEVERWTNNWIGKTPPSTGRDLEQKLFDFRQT